MPALGRVNARGAGHGFKHAITRDDSLGTWHFMVTTSMSHEDLWPAVQPVKETDMQPDTKGNFSAKARSLSRARVFIAGISQRLVLAWVLAIPALIAAPAHAQNPMEGAGATSIAYMKCLTQQNAATADAAIRALVEQCGYDPGKPTDQFVDEILAVIPGDPLAPMQDQLASVRKNYTEEQFSYLLGVEKALQTARSFDEASDQLAILETQAVQTLGRARADLEVLATISAARFAFDFFAEGGVSLTFAKGWLRDLVNVGKVVIGFAVGFGLAGPIGACILAWVVMATLDTD